MIVSPKPHVSAPPSLAEVIEAARKGEGLIGKLEIVEAVPAVVVPEDEAPVDPREPVADSVLQTITLAAEAEALGRDLQEALEDEERRRLAAEAAEAAKTAAPAPSTPSVWETPGEPILPLERAVVRDGRVVEEPDATLIARQIRIEAELRQREVRAEAVRGRLDSTLLKLVAEFSELERSVERANAEAARAQRHLDQARVWVEKVINLADGSSTAGLLRLAVPDQRGSELAGGRADEHADDDPKRGGHW